MLDNWTHLDIAGKPADVFVPPGVQQPRFGMLFLHPYGLETLCDNAVWTKLFAQHQLVCVSPHTQQSWWVDRVYPTFDAALTPEHHLLQNVVPYFHERWHLAPRAIGLVGISMGGQGALRLAFKHPKMFPVVAAVSSAIEYHELYHQGTAIDDMYDSKEQCRQDTAPMWVPPFQPPPHVYFCIDPTDDEWLRGNERLHEKLNALGVPHTCDLTTQAGGHSWDYFDHMAETVVSFAVKGLEQEALRLL